MAQARPTPFDAYEVLQVSREATTVEIKRSYHRLALKHHPDKSTSGPDAFLKIDQAYEILSDEKKRRIYDRYGEAGLTMSKELPSLDLDQIPAIITLIIIIMLLALTQLVLLSIKIDAPTAWSWHTVAAPSYIFTGIAFAFAVASFVLDSNYFPVVLAGPAAVVVALAAHAATSPDPKFAWIAFGLYVAIECSWTLRKTLRCVSLRQPLLAAAASLPSPLLRIASAAMVAVASADPTGPLASAPIRGVIVAPLYLIPLCWLAGPLRNSLSVPAKIAIKMVPALLAYTMLGLLTARLASSSGQPYVAVISIPMWIIIGLGLFMFCIISLFLTLLLSVMVDDATTKGPRKMITFPAPMAWVAAAGEVLASASSSTTIAANYSSRGEP